MIAVKEFIADLHEGYTNAFLCRGEDGYLYVTKSRKSGRESLIREWICGRVGRQLGLTIPPIEQLYADAAVAGYAANEQILELASEPGFGSRFIAGNRNGAAVSVPTLNVANVAHVDMKARTLLLLFDWWILNFDRTDDNPNLLWDAVARKLHVIDHNLAFDEGPSQEFWDRHIFRESREQFADSPFRIEQSVKMTAILMELPRFWAELPQSWVDAGTLTLDRVDMVLRRCITADFWQAI